MVNTTICYKNMRSTDTESHFRYLHMSKEDFDVLLSKVNTTTVLTSAIKYTVDILPSQRHFSSYAGLCTPLSLLSTNTQIP